MSHKVIFIALLLLGKMTVSAQKSTTIDSRLQPLLKEFLAYCKTYNIPYQDKLRQLKDIDITNNLPLEENNTILGHVRRDQTGKIDGILIHWAAMMDPEILKVVAFHEFGHHFLDYKHSCQDCNEIMAVTNSSYFDIARDWDNQVAHLFTTSPAYLSGQPQSKPSLAYQTAASPN
ncbi:hypothetical protein [Croceiramulus getboli]|nr:hypothetical protein P8624_06455 [Flavobacteriaceae bacterium YJPT1-3]